MIFNKIILWDLNLRGLKDLNFSRFIILFYLLDYIINIFLNYKIVFL